jgi:hypothetical protein
MFRTGLVDGVVLALVSLVLPVSVRAWLEAARRE